jgi:deoxyadenosine/deoxycytidine kinase
MILTFEGAPAVGKSTVSANLHKLHGSYVVPEVNKLFGKENRESDLWYYQKQVERWKIATSNKKENKLVILDGDVFQPIWFNALFSEENWGNFDNIVEFYRPMVVTHKILFPSGYVYFHVGEELRSEREFERSTALGRSHESIVKKIVRYSKLATFQERYFSNLSNEFPGLVFFLESKDITISTQTINSYSKSHNYDGIDIFEHIVLWCRNIRSEKLSGF